MYNSTAEPLWPQINLVSTDYKTCYYHSKCVIYHHFSHVLCSSQSGKMTGYNRGRLIWWYALAARSNMAAKTHYGVDLPFKPGSLAVLGWQLNIKRGYVHVVGSSITKTIIPINTRQKMEKRFLLNKRYVAYVAVNYKTEASYFNPM